MTIYILLLKDLGKDYFVYKVYTDRDEAYKALENHEWDDYSWLTEPKIEEIELDQVRD